MNELVIQQDLLAYGGLISVLFPYSPSVNYVMAINLAKMSARYQRLDDESDKKKALHLALFARTKEQAGHASALLRIVGKWKGVQVYTQSRIASDGYDVSKVLECYFQSLSLEDSRAHCFWSGDGYDGEKDTVFPCKQIRGWVGNEYREHENTRSLKIPMKDRILDLAVRKNCDWCPNFKIENFRE